MEGTTRKDIEGLLNNKGFNWLRSQRNRQIIVACQAALLALVASGSYYKEFKEWFGADSPIPLFVFIAIFLLTLAGFILLRISVRGIAEAPDELLDERQIAVRNTSFRYAYYAMGYVVLGLLSLMFFGPELRMFQPEGNDGSYLMIATLFAYASMPSMVMAWRERDI